MILENNSESRLSKETFGQMTKWMRYHYCRRRYSSSLLYGEMNTVHDLIKIFDNISRGDFDSSLEEWNRSQQHLNEMITSSQAERLGDDF